MNIVVTGGLGFIGSNLVKRFKKNETNKILIIDNFKRENIERNIKVVSGSNVSIVRSDVRFYYDFKELHEFKPDVILHYAGNAGIPWSLQNPESDFHENAIGTFNLLNVARERNAAVIMASSNRVYPISTGWPLDEAPTRYVPHDDIIGIDESFNPFGQRSPYGTSKLAADLLCQEWYHSFGVRTVINRMGVIYGPGQWGATEQGWLGYFCRLAALNQRITIFGTGKQVRDPLYIDDLVDLVEYQVEHIDELAGQVFNVGGGLANSISLLETCESLKAAYEFAPIRVADMDWYVTNYTKVSRATGWKPSINILDGIGLTSEWVKDEIKASL